MSIPFSNTTTKKGIIQLIEKNLGFTYGTISSDSTVLAEFTADVNLALDRAWDIILGVNTTHQHDDKNYLSASGEGKYPIVYLDIVSGTRQYPLTVDADSNLVLEIYKVFVTDNNGLVTELTPVDVQNGTAPSNYYDGLNVNGTPNTYDKLGSVIYLDPIPDYNKTDGLIVYIDREASYFLTSDTTKTAGFAGIYHEYLVFRPCYQYASRKGLENQAYFEKETFKYEEALRSFYQRREKDVQKTMRARVISSR